MGKHYRKRKKFINFNPPKSTFDENDIFHFDAGPFAGSMAYNKKRINNSTQIDDMSDEEFYAMIKELGIKM